MNYILSSWNKLVYSIIHKSREPDLTYFRYLLYLETFDSSFDYSEPKNRSGECEGWDRIPLFRARVFRVNSAVCNLAIKTFCSENENLRDEAISGRLSTVNSEYIQHAIEQDFIPKCRNLMTFCIPPKRCKNDAEL